MVIAVLNKSQSPFIDSYNSQEYEIPPGKVAFVPLEAARLWFGVDVKDGALVRDRSELVRAATRAGYIGGPGRRIEDFVKHFELRLAQEQHTVLEQTIPIKELTVKDTKSYGVWPEKPKTLVRTGQSS